MLPLFGANVLDHPALLKLRGRKGRSWEGSEGGRDNIYRHSNGDHTAVGVARVTDKLAIQVSGSREGGREREREGGREGGKEGRRERERER